MNRKIVIATRPLDGGGYAASVVEDSWADITEENPNLGDSVPNGCGFLGWSTFENDREESEHDAFVVQRSRLRGFAADGDVYEFAHKSESLRKAVLTERDNDVRVTVSRTSPDGTVKLEMSQMSAAGNTAWTYAALSNAIEDHTAHWEYESGGGEVK